MNGWRAMRQLNLGSMKFYKRDPDRALSGMAELTPQQRGVYNSIIDLLYSRDGDVEDDDRRVAKMLTIHWLEYRTVKTQLVMLGKVWNEGGKLRARRVQATINEAASFALEQGKRAASRWAKDEKPKGNNDAPMRPGNACARVLPIATPRKIETDKSVSSSKPPPGAFDGFWISCPRKVGKGAARKAYAKALLKTAPETLLAGMQRYASSRAGQQEEFTAHPATWLNAERWLDEGKAASAPAIIADISSFPAFLHPLIAEIGTAKFTAWFGDAQITEGPPTKFVFAKPFQRSWVIGHFTAQLQRAFTEYELETAA